MTTPLRCACGCNAPIPDHLPGARWYDERWFLNDDHRDGYARAEFARLSMLAPMERPCCIIGCGGVRIGAHGMCRDHRNEYARRNDAERTARRRSGTGRQPARPLNAAKLKAARP
jgi:hypothetical protein